MRVAIGVPVLSNFKGFAELVHSLYDENVKFYVADNWEDNRGVSKAWNLFMDSAIKEGIDLLVICNDDIVWQPGSFRGLLRAWDDKRNSTILVSGVAHDVTPGYHEAPDYSCFAFNPLEMRMTVGYFDEAFTPAYFEDNDSHYRIKLSGYGAYCHSEARVEHKGSQTQNSDPSKPVVTSQMFEANRAYYVEKWGGVPGSETFNTPFNDPNKSIKDFR